VTSKGALDDVEVGNIGQKVSRSWRVGIPFLVVYSVLRSIWRTPLDSGLAIDMAVRWCSIERHLDHFRLVRG
jgi:hypothetical protein